MRPIAKYKIWCTVEQRFITEAETNSSTTYTLLPYTGYQDSTGTPIYMGDIVRTEVGTGTVEDGNGSPVVHYLDHSKVGINQAIRGKVAVLGNKYTHMPDGTLANEWLSNA